VLERLPTHLNSRIDELLPHNWKPSAIAETGLVSQKIPS